MNNTGLWYLVTLIAIGLASYVLFELFYDPTYKARCEYLTKNIAQVQRYGPGSAEREREHLEDLAEYARRDCENVLSNK